MLHCTRHIQNFGIFKTLFIQIYAGIFNHIQHFMTYSRMTMHYEGIFRLIEAYKASSVTLVYPQSTCIPSRCIFTTGGISKTLWKNTLFRHYLDIFGHIQDLFESFHMSQPAMWEILEYSEFFPNCIPTQFRTLSHLLKQVNPLQPWKFRILAYWQSWNTQNTDIFKTQCIFRVLSKI